MNTILKQRTIALVTKNEPIVDLDSLCFIPTLENSLPTTPPQNDNDKIVHQYMARVNIFFEIDVIFNSCIDIKRYNLSQSMKRVESLDDLYIEFMHISSKLFHNNIGIRQTDRKLAGIRLRWNLPFRHNEGLIGAIKFRLLKLAEYLPNESHNIFSDLSSIYFEEITNSIYNMNVNGLPIKVGIHQHPIMINNFLNHTMICTKFILHDSMACLRYASIAFRETIVFNLIYGVANSLMFHDLFGIKDYGNIKVQNDDIMHELRSHDALNGTLFDYLQCRVLCTKLYNVYSRIPCIPLYMNRDKIFELDRL